MSLRYTIYLPTANQAVLQLDGSKEETFYSVAAAMNRVQRRYPTAFLEDGE